MRAGRRSLPAPSGWLGCSSTRCRCGCGFRRTAAVGAAATGAGGGVGADGAQHVGLSEIQQACGRWLGELFDTLMVFENYPIDRVGLAAEAAGIRLGRVGGHDATHYPLSLMVQPGQRRAAAAARLPAGPLRARKRSGSGGAAAASAGGRGCRPGACDRPARCAVVFESATPSCGVERHRARGAARDAARAVCRAGGAHAGCDRGGVRGPAAELRASSTRMPTSWRIGCTFGRWARTCGRGVRRAFGGTGRWLAGGAESRRRLRAARSRISGRAAARHDDRCGLGRRADAKPVASSMPVPAGVKCIELDRQDSRQDTSDEDDSAPRWSWIPSIWPT